MQIKIDDNWINVLPSMISTCRRSGRVADFESFIMQHPYSASDYASSIIRDRWPEAEEIIRTDAAAAFNYARNVIRGRWEEAEDIIATDAQHSFAYAKSVLRGRFEKGEQAIATNINLSFNYAKDILKGRFVLGEPTIAAPDATSSSSAFAKNYYELIIKDPSDWSSWTIDQLKHSPCWMYMYAKEYMHGRLPDILHNTMNVFAMTMPNNYYVQRYFKAKKYNKKIKRRKKVETPNQSLGG